MAFLELKKEDQSSIKSYEEDRLQTENETKAREKGEFSMRLTYKYSDYIFIDKFE
jgi:hypothetical protein